jgi:hypothetical protein
VVIDPATGRIAYVPDTDFHGTDAFTYQVCDVDVPLGCDSATVRIGMPPTDALAPTDPPSSGTIVAGGALLAGAMTLLIALAAPPRRRRRPESR